MIEEKENITLTERNNWWRFIPLILWIIVIFYSSTGNASMARTSRFLRPLLEFFFSSEDTIFWANVIIRKIAHLTYYAFLAALAVFAFIGTPFQRLRKNWFVASFVLVLIIATIDEIIQSFDTSRVGSWTDVMLDCVGGMATFLTYYLWLKVKQRRTS